MTTIVYRNGVLAADSRAYSGDLTPIGHKMKIRRLKDGSLAGVTTARPGYSEAILNWMDTGCNPNILPPTVDPDFAALLIRPNGEVFYFYDGWMPSGPIVAPYFTIGSGEKYALAALSMGADAQTAVAVACELDGLSDGPVTSLELHPAEDAPVEPAEAPQEAAVDVAA